MQMVPVVQSALDTTLVVLRWMGNSLCFCVLRAGWNRIFTLSLFVEHMLLDIEHVEEKLAPLVLKHTKLLCQVSLRYLYSPDNEGIHHHKMITTIIPVPKLRSSTSILS